MANATATELQQLYIAYFGRAADPSGLDYWTDAGITTKAFAANMYAQNEFKSVYGSLSVEAQVNQIYQNLFDRDADATGLLYWTQQINNGTLELASIANDLIWAANNNSGSEDDKTALTNKTNAAVAYTAKVKETTSGILAYAAASTDPWVAGDNIEAVKTYFNGIDKDTPHTTAGIASSVSTIISNGVQDGKYTLTSDSPSLTEGDTGTKTLSFTVSLDRAASAATTVNYETLTTGTATAGDDFVAGSGTVSFAKGQKTATVEVTVNGDTTYENSGTAETVKVKFSGSDLSADVTATGSITENDTDPSTVSKSFTLTTGVNEFTGGDAADTFDASTSGSLSNGDTLVGGSGTDTLTASLGASTTTVNTTGIETFNITATGAATLNMAAASGVTQVTNVGSSAALTLNNLASIPTVDINTNSQSTTLNFSNAALAGTSDELVVNLHGVDDPSSTDNSLSGITITRAAGATNDLETVKLVSSSVANVLETFDGTAVDVTTLKIAGDQNFTLVDTLSTEVTTVSGGDATGALTFTTGAVAATITTGSGADTITAGSASDTIISGSGADSVTGGGGADNVTSGAGADTIVLSGANNDTVSAGAGADTITAATGNDSIDGGADIDLINFTVDGLTSDDTVDGGTGTDVFAFTDAATSADADFTNVTNVETLQTADLNDGAGNDTTLVLTTEAAEAGITTITHQGHDTTDSITIQAGFTNDLTINLDQTDATAADGVSIDANTSSFTKNLTVNAGILTFANGVNIQAGSGTADVLRFNGTSNTTAASIDVTNFETFQIDSDTNSAITLQDSNGASGLATFTIDATAITTSSKTSTVDAGNEADVTKVVYKGGAGIDTYTISQVIDSVTGGAADDIIIFTGANLLSTDTIDGGAGTDILRVLDDATAIADSIFSGVSNVETLEYKAGMIENATLDSNASTAGITAFNFRSVDEAGGLTVTAGFANDLTVTLNALDTSSIADVNAGDAQTVTATAFTKKLTVDVTGLTLASDNTITGGTGTTDELVFDGTANTTHSNMAGITKIETFKAESDATVAFTLASGNAGDGETLTLTAAALTTTTNTALFDAQKDTDGNIIIIGGAGADTITGSASDNGDSITSGTGADVLKFLTGKLDSADTIDGGAGTDVLEIATDDTIEASTFTNISNVETLTGASNAALDITVGSAASTAGIATITLADTGGGDSVTVDATFSGALTVNALTAGVSTVDLSSATNTTTIKSTEEIMDGDVHVLTGGTGGTEILSISFAAAGAGAIDDTQGATLVDLDKWVLTDDHATSYANTITLADANASYTNASTYHTLTIDATDFSGSAADKLVLVASNEDDAKIIVLGGAGADSITASTSANFGDSISGGAGADIFTIATASFTSIDTIAGGDGDDILTLSNDATVVDADFTNVTSIKTLTTGTNIDFTSLKLGTNAAAAGVSVIDGSSHNGAMTVTGEAGFSNALEIQLDTGIDMDDNIDMSLSSGAITITQTTAQLHAEDTIKGGTGTGDVLKLTADDGTATTTLMTGVETITIVDATNKSATVVMGANDTQIASGKTLTVNASGLTTTNVFAFTGTESETDGNVSVTGAGGADTLTGTAGNDTLVGGAGIDSLTGGSGDDSYTGGSGVDIYNLGTQSQADGDTITDFATGEDIVISLDYSAIGSGVSVQADRASAGVANSALATTLSSIRGSYVYDTTNSKLVVDVNGDQAITSSDISVTINAASTAANTIAADDLIWSITGGAGNDTIVGDDQADTLLGGLGNDNIKGGLGVDVITGGGGQDTITGGAGRDTITISTGNNVVVLGGTAATLAAGDLMAAAIDATGSGDTVTGFTDDDKLDVSHLTLINEDVRIILDKGDALNAAILIASNFFAAGSVGGTNYGDVSIAVGSTGASGVAYAFVDIDGDGDLDTTDGVICFASTANANFIDATGDFIT